MESSDKLDLESLLQAWEANLKQSRAFSRSDVQELKTHLLDLYDDLIETGLNEEEAFLIASKRLGQPVDWENEFTQTNQPFISCCRFYCCI